jgi:hypothetical protein
MTKFSQITMLLCLFTLLFSSCSKETVDLNTQKQTSQQIAIEEKDFAFDPTFVIDDASRGMCGTMGVSVEYIGKQEFEFDVNFNGWGVFHFSNTPSGTIKTKSAFPMVVQEQKITLTNKPLAKQNPKCPWLGRPTGTVVIKVMMVQKDTYGQWEQVPGTGSVSYTLGDKAADKVLMGGGRVFCIDDAIAKFKMCMLYY